MVGIARSRRLLLRLRGALGGACLGWLAVSAPSGCNAASTAPVGVSPPRSPELGRAPDAQAPAPSPVPADFRAHMTRVTDRFLSRGHGERFDAVVWANDAAVPAVRGEGDGTDGAMIVEESVAHGAANGLPAGYFVMQRWQGAWHFVAVDAGGAVTSDRPDACAACHGQAPSDVFPLPR